MVNPRLSLDLRELSTYSLHLRAQLLELLELEREAMRSALGHHQGLNGVHLEKVFL